MDSAIPRMGSTSMDLKFWWVVIIGYLPCFFIGYGLKNWEYRKKIWQLMLLMICGVIWLVLIANSIYSPPFELRVMMSLLHFELGLSTVIVAIVCRWLVDKGIKHYGRRQAS